MDLEEVWRIREEEIYPRIFGDVSRGTFTLPAELFTGRFGQNDVDPRWPFYGVFEFAPTRTRPAWLYVTSGHSNPWDDEPDAYDPAGRSGSGREFVFASLQQGDWAVSFLHNMLAFDLLLGAGRFPERQPLEVGDRVPLRSPINGAEECLIRNVVVTDSYDLPTEMALPSGRANFLVFTGITDDELAHAKTHGSGDLVRRLRRAGYCPLTDVSRPALR